MSTETNGNERKNGCAAGYPVGLLAAVWCGSGEERPQGYAWQLDGCGGMRVAGARRLLMDQVDLMDLMDKMGASCDTPRVCGAL